MGDSGGERGRLTTSLTRSSVGFPSGPDVALALSYGADILTCTTAAAAQGDPSKRESARGLCSSGALLIGRREERGGGGTHLVEHHDGRALPPHRHRPAESVKHRLGLLRHAHADPRRRLLRRLRAGSQEAARGAPGSLVLGGPSPRQPPAGSRAGARQAGGRTFSALASRASQRAMSTAGRSGLSSEAVSAMFCTGQTVRASHMSTGTHLK